MNWRSEYNSIGVEEWEWADKREGKEGGTEERETSAAAAAAAQPSSPLQIVVKVVLVEETDTKGCVRPDDCS